MNYRHAFHAGSFADVVKHAVLVRILVHLGAKPAAFRVIDTHAGAGAYDLAGPEASRSPEWREGIHRLFTMTVGEEARALLAPYLDVVARLNPSGRLVAYPGSPALVRAFLRPQDRLVACELEPNAAAALARNLDGDRRSKALAIDGWTALNAYVPPRERRGLVLIDPPFEDAGDFPRLARGLESAHRKWPGGTYLLWYPIKERAARADEPGPGRVSSARSRASSDALCARTMEELPRWPLASLASAASDALARRLRRSGIAKILRAELSVPRDADRLGACGLIVVNPPWTLESELHVLLPALAAVLSGAGGGAHRVDWLTGDK